MRARLEHVGIAVDSLPASLAFFRDALGLELEASEEVSSQRVRAHFVKAGDASLELLESTSPDSAIAKFIARRGPGLHHLTLRVDDLEAALAQLKSRGIRLIDDRPRPGAERARVAFIHPSSAHGVLVELKESPGTDPPLRVTRYTLGDFELISAHDGRFRLDGGAMFGAVPKVLWQQKSPPDAGNRISMTMRPLIVRGDKTVLIDAGMGDNESAKFYSMYAADRSRTLDDALAEAGMSAEDIDLVVATHLHFDHAGGFTMLDGEGRLRPRFPKARYLVRRGEWDDATRTHERNRASYVSHNFVPLAEAGVVDFIDGDGPVIPGVRVQRTGGHTMHHQMIWIESGQASAAFVADMFPTASHVPPAWIMGYDLYPMDTLASKRAILREAAERGTLVFFEHDPAIPAAVITEHQGTYAVTPATT
jgi:methylmalonyl-CoA epimerase